MMSTQWVLCYSVLLWPLLCGHLTHVHLLPTELGILSAVLIIYSLFISVNAQGLLLQTQFGPPNAPCTVVGLQYSGSHISAIMSHLACLIKWIFLGPLQIMIYEVWSVTQEPVFLHHPRGFWLEGHKTPLPHPLKGTDLEVIVQMVGF